MQNEKTSNVPTQDSNSIFPMRMTSIEKLHWLDDDPRLPNLVFCRLRVDGDIDIETARRAWTFALARHPLANAKPAIIAGRWEWTQGIHRDSDSEKTNATWATTGFQTWESSMATPWKYRKHQIAGKTGCYLGIATTPSNDGNGGKRPGTAPTDIWFYNHHAIADGAGSIMVINEWMIIYSNLMNGRPPETGLSRLEHGLLQRRNHLGLLSWRFLKHLPKQPIAIFGAAKFIFRKTVELLPQPSRQPEQSEQEGDAYPSIQGKWISSDGVCRLNDYAKELDVRLNSIFLGQLYLTLLQWRTELGFQEENDWLRIIVPMSIRQISDRRLPLANRATIVQVDRCKKDMIDTEKFYRQLDREIRVIRTWQLDRMFLLAIRCLSLSNPLLKREANNRKSRGMAVFTNLGEPLRKSERNQVRLAPTEPAIRPVEFDFVGPIRAGTPLNFSVAQYQGKLRVSLHFDAQVLQPSQANSLLDIFVDRLTRITAVN